MAYRSSPVTELLSLEDVRFNIRHVDRFIRLDDSDIDESHIHNCYEIYVNVSGDISFLVENKLYPVQSGDSVVTRPGEMHLCVYHSACVHEHFCLWIEVPEGSSLFSFINQPEFCNLYAPDSRARQEMLDLLYRLDELRWQNNQELERTARFLQLLSLLGKRPEIGPKSQVNMPGELQNILDYINEHFREIQHIKEIYDLFFISPSTINRWFQKYIHLSPHEFLESKKLACAQQLLTRNLTVTQVCLQCGFTDSSRFIAVFKKKFGETPYRYKLNNKAVK
ncbi:MAG: AraC family transcriptional regulator [Eubacteriales bacterium]